MRPVEKARLDPGENQYWADKTRAPNAGMSNKIEPAS
jgi:hypothetical protein